jgi:hypothetical protein
MAKPPIGDLPPVWGDAGNYPASNYPVTLPDLSGQANPLQGPTPWSGQPRLNAAGLGAYASAGFTPQVPNDPSPLNEWFRRVQVHVSWVQDGTSAADATAHIMETDASGFAAAVKYIATAGIEGAGASPVILIEGASVPAGKTFTLDGSGTINGAMTFFGAAGGSLSSDPSAVLTWNGEAGFTGRLRVLTGTSVAEGDLSKSGGNLRYRDSASTRYVHTSDSGWFKGVGIDASSGPVATASVDTSAAVAPLATADVHVSASGWVSRTLAGAVTISVIEVGGAGQIGTSSTLDVPATGGSTFQPFTFDRIRAGADTTARVYRLEIAGGGSNVTTRNLKITATPGAS